MVGSFFVLYVANVEFYDINLFGDELTKIPFFIRGIFVKFATL